MASLSKFHCSVYNDSKKNSFWGYFFKLAQPFHHHRKIASLLNYLEKSYTYIATFISWIPKMLYEHV